LVVALAVTGGTQSELVEHQVVVVVTKTVETS
jgi:hypothetical protein